MKQKEKSGTTRGKTAPLTLIEITLSLCILLMIGGLTGIQGRSFFKGHQYRIGVQRLKSEVRLLKLLAVSLNADITLTFQYEGHHLTLLMDTDEKMPYLFKPLVLEADSCLFDHQELEARVVHYSRSLQEEHELELSLHSDSLIIKL